MKKLVALLLALTVLAMASVAMAGGKVMLYSSMQEAQLQAIEQAFEAKYPNVDMEYYYAGGGKLVTKMTTEAQDGGQIASDLVWLGDPSDYEAFKANGWLQPYVSPETEHIAKEYMDPEGYYTAGRLVTMGVAWNIGLVDEADAPKTWNDFLDPKWNNQIIMTDPSQASPYLGFCIIAAIQYLVVEAWDGSVMMIWLFHLGSSRSFQVLGASASSTPMNQAMPMVTRRPAV